MDDRSEIDAVRALLGAKPRPVGWAERRERLDEVGSVWPVAEDISLTDVDLGDACGEWSIAPGSDASRALLFFHGGGYCSGSILSHRRMVTEAGRAAGVRTLAVGYRLAPEHPFPAAYEDALSSWHILLSQGYTPHRIAVGGDSAGGGLTIGLINRLRHAGEEQPACAWLASPWTDLTLSGDTLELQGCCRPADPQGLSAGTRRRLSLRQDGPQGPARFPAVWRSERLSGDADSGRLRRDAARRRNALRRRRGRGGCCGDAGDLAAYDPRLAPVECASWRRPPRAGERWTLYQGACREKGLSVGAPRAHCSTRRVGVVIEASAAPPEG